jgi:hypothetical protein
MEAPTNVRGFANYFVVCGLQSIEPYKKSNGSTTDLNPLETSYMPSILSRYPQADLKDSPLPSTLGLVSGYT